MEQENQEAGLIHELEINQKMAMPQGGPLSGIFGLFLL